MIGTIVSWFTSLFSWLARIFQWFKGMFVDFLEFLADLPVLILEGILDGVVYVLSGIPVPDFMQAGAIQGLFNNLSSDVLYFIDFFGIDLGLVVIGGGVLFRLTRKALTLGQW